ncbi:MAG: CIA30 family protein [Verrucomicrobia bacterium]|nr:CIA30 family protein [Verrucomicrobiota bacterium]
MHHLRNFSLNGQEPAWQAQNDGVMGGVSTGQARIIEGTLLFSGELSLENNGGFAQIYSPAERSDFSAFSKVRLRVKGDGRTYQFRLATDDRFRGSRIAYRGEFETAQDQWIEVSIPLSAFQPSHHGRDLSGPPIDLSSIRQIAFLLGDGVPGPFALKVEWIGLE